MQLSLAVLLVGMATVDGRSNSEPQQSLTPSDSDTGSGFETCPYADLGSAEAAGSTSYQCHPSSPGHGDSCPELQSKRIGAVWQWYKDNKMTYINAGKGYTVAALFDKAHVINGMENYEKMDNYHIECLDVDVHSTTRPNGAHKRLGDDGEAAAQVEMTEQSPFEGPFGRDLMFGLEDKAELKSLAVAIPTDSTPGGGMQATQVTETFLYAWCPDFHIDETTNSCVRESIRGGAEGTKHNANRYDRKTLEKKLEDFCTTRDSFMIKPTHLSWSAGLKIVTGWKETCTNGKEQAIAALVKHVEDGILTRKNRESDAHLTLLDGGFTVEELFSSGGESKRPLEAKVQVLFGKVWQIFFVGEDPRGCTVGSGAWNIYPQKDGTVAGWTMKGMLPAKDRIHNVYMDKFHKKVISIAEKFASGVKADWTRVDLFLSGFGEGEDAVIKLNEIENVSGYKFPWEALYLGDAWLQGYMEQNGAEREAVAITTETWGRGYSDLVKLRDAFKLDSEPPPSQPVEDDDDDEFHDADEAPPSEPVEDDADEAPVRTLRRSPGSSNLKKLGEDTAAAADPDVVG